MHHPCLFPSSPSGADLRRFLGKVQTLAVVAEAEARLGERHEDCASDVALTHYQASCEAEAELVALITGPVGKEYLTLLDVMLRSEVAR